MKEQDLSKTVDSIIAIDSEIQRAIRKKEIQRRIHSIQNRCGSCTKWMIKSLCNREKHKKVTSSEYICNDFEIQPISKELVEGLKTKLKNI